MELMNILKLGTMGYKPAEIKQLSESGIDSDTVIELAKNGYKAEDVNELIKLASTEPKPQPEKEEPDKKPDDAGKPAGESEAQPDIDKLKKELEEQKALVTKLQKKNASEDLGTGKTETARDSFRNALKNLY